MKCWCQYHCHCQYYFLQYYSLISTFDQAFQECLEGQHHREAFHIHVVEEHDHAVHVVDDEDFHRVVVDGMEDIHEEDTHRQIHWVDSCRDLEDDILVEVDHGHEHDVEVVHDHVGDGRDVVDRMTDTYCCWDWVGYVKVKLPHWVDYSCCHH